MRLTRVRIWAIRLVAHTAGVVTAAQLVTLFRLDGSLGQQASAVAIIAIVLAVGPSVGRRAIRPASRRAQKWAARVRDGWLAAALADDRMFFASIGLLWAGAVIQLAVSCVRLAGLIWASAWLCRAIGLPVSVPWFWPAAVAALVVASGRCLASQLLTLWRSRRAGPVLAPHASVALGLLATAALPAAGFPPAASDDARFLTLVVLSVAFTLVDLWLVLPFLTTLVRLAVNGVKLWLLALASGWLVAPLEIHGWWPHVLGALFITVTTTPVWWYDRARERYESPPLEPMLGPWGPMW